MLAGVCALTALCLGGVHDRQLAAQRAGMMA
jgi:hypothetical protein